MKAKSANDLSPTPYLTLVISYPIRYDMFEVKTTAEFDEWLTSLKDRVGKAKIVSRLQRLELGNAGDHSSVGDGVSELRVHSGPGYRVYYKQTDMTIIVILCGGDKSTQDKDIRRAKDVAAGL
jgi:putative addiction module killer protein